MATPIVFVPHQAMRFEQDLNRCVPALDISKAAAYGRIVTVTSSSHAVVYTADLQLQIKSAMAEYQQGRDFILAVGDPIIISACAIEASKKGDFIDFLKWNRSAKLYVHERVYL
ncbi:hypothetical protein Gekk315_00004 [Aeromonas phage Gekk3-15]